MFGQLPSEVSIYEVGPRDGLQNEEAFVKTEDKLALIAALAESGLSRIEITSFVHPRWIPALADADRVAGAVPALDGVVYTALVPNARGLERALKTDLTEIAVFMSASESHNKQNINKTRDETYSAFEPVFEACQARGIAVRAYVSTVWGCPYEGHVEPAESAAIAQRLIAMGAYEVSLGDTIGIGNPLQTCRVLDAVGSAVPLEKIAMHMHDTRGTALANCVVGLEYGVTTFDSSIGGLGGCPYAPGASGNLATEDLARMLQDMGIETGVSLTQLYDAGLLAQELLGRELPGRALKACAAERHVED